MYNFLSVVDLKPSRALEYLKHDKYEGDIPFNILYKKTLDRY